MNNVNFVFERMSGSELQRVIEPLASYICATERPQAALKSALDLLFREVMATNQTASSHFRSCLQN